MIGGDTQVALQLLDRPALVRGDEAHDHAGSAGAGRPPGAVHVVLGVGRGVEMNDGVDPVDVDAPSGHVGRHQRVDIAPHEGVQRLLALLLAAVTVDGRGTDTPVSSWRAIRSVPCLVRQKMMVGPDGGDDVGRRSIRSPEATFQNT